MFKFALVSLVNDRMQFEACQASLRRTVDPLPLWLMVEPNQHGWNAAQGLNYGLELLNAKWIICVHQDVLFPADFWHRLTVGLESLSEDTALAGLVGCDRNGRFRGHIVDPNGHCYWPSLPHEVLTLDEVLIVVRKSSGLRFCAEVPGFHCYGADICYQADAQGLRAAVIDAPLVHLSTGRLDASYERAAAWLLSKWGARYGHLLPMPAVLLCDVHRATWWRQVMLRIRRRSDRKMRNANKCPGANCAARLLAEQSAGEGHG
jgi:hypothetical protein